MKRVLFVTCIALTLSLAVNAGTIQGLLPPGITPDTTTNEPFPTAGDAYCSATGGCGNIPAGGQTAFMWTAGDYVMSSIFVLPTNGVTGITANWSYQDFLGGGNTETWFALVNGVAVAQATLPDDNFVGDILTVTGSVSFAAIAPVGGGYQVELVLQNTVPGGGGSVAWLDGGITGLSYSSGVPEPSSMLLLGSGLLLVGFVRRKLSR
jgi:PEP-CTERM motif